MKTESGNRTESENRILAENVYCENYRKCSDGQKGSRRIGEWNRRVDWKWDRRESLESLLESRRRAEGTQNENGKWKPDGV